MLLFGDLHCYTRINNVLSPVAPILIQEENHELYRDKEMQHKIHFFWSC